jgi:hypothetical protein
LIGRLRRLFDPLEFPFEKFLRDSDAEDFPHHAIFGQLVLHSLL